MSPGLVAELAAARMHDVSTGSNSAACLESECAVHPDDVSFAEYTALACFVEGGFRRRIAIASVLQGPWVDAFAHGYGGYTRMTFTVRAVSSTL